MVKQKTWTDLLGPDAGNAFVDGHYIVRGDERRTVLFAARDHVEALACLRRWRLEQGIHCPIAGDTAAELVKALDMLARFNHPGLYGLVATHWGPDAAIEMFKGVKAFVEKHEGRPV